jgi:transglutaminase-like putative cysteine protease
VCLDLAHAFEAVLEHALVPLRIEHARAGLQRDLLLQGADLAAAGGLVRDVDGHVVARARASRRGWMPPSVSKYWSRVVMPTSIESRFW